MDSMVGTVESPWRKMVYAIETLEHTLLVLYVLIVLVWLLNILFLLSGRIDVGGWLLAFIALASGYGLYAMHEFSEGVLERVRQLSSPV